jgi:hypothetical protein
MIRSPTPAAVVGELLSDISDREMRELCVRALRLAYAGAPDGHIGLNGHLSRNLVGLLVERKGWPTSNNALGTPAEFASRAPTHVAEALYQAFGQSNGLAVFEFVNWFVRAGLAWPVCDAASGIPHTFKLTRAGHRLLKGSEDHPLLPGFLERLADRCPGLPNDVLSLMGDARTCLDHGLMRPAVVLLGVAYEVAIEHVVQALVAKGVLDAAVQDQNAAKRIAAVRGKIDALVQDKDDRFAAHAAYEFADQLRRRRNDASHTAPTYGFEDREEVEDLIISAGRQMPNLWCLH